MVTRKVTERDVLGKEKIESKLIEDFSSTPFFLTGISVAYPLEKLTIH